MAREVVEVITPSTTDDLPEGSTNKYDTGAPPADLDAIADGATYSKATAAQLTKVDGVEDSATADQTGLEMQTSIVGIADADRVLIGSEPQSGEKKIYGIHRNASGNLEMDSEDTAV